MVRILLVDNYDSFTYNIAHYLGILNYDVHIIRNDSPLLKKINRSHYTHIILSPGPGSPNDSGYTFEVIKDHYKQLPILGVCLGHQCLAKFFNADIVYAKKIMHGKISVLHNNGKSIFTGLPQKFKIVRYHSLCVNTDCFPACLQILAWIQTPDTKLEEIMAIRHREYNIFGVQYHPEAALTEYGLDIFKNFVKITEV